ncbi:MAG: hypothetical protein JWN70_6062 [Planctomycetaceae bacterium]|nr:hypothetical protein [Planctomycetaceae bacterium]
MTFIPIPIRVASPEAARAAESAEKKAFQVEDQLRVLSARFEHLTLVTQTLWELLAQHGNLTQEQMFDKMQEIDLRDGEANCKIGKPTFLCNNCGHRVSATFEVCIYCGAPPDLAPQS